MQIFCYWENEQMWQYSIYSVQSIVNFPLHKYYYRIFSNQINLNAKLFIQMIWWNIIYTS